MSPDVVDTPRAASPKAPATPDVASEPELRQISIAPAAAPRRRRLTKALGLVKRGLGRTLSLSRTARMQRRAARRLAEQRMPIRLCLGSGSAPIPDWTNVDLSGRPDVRLDLRFGLPTADGSISRIYSEHFIEHIERVEGQKLFAECRRVLAEDGVLRIATPDLAELTEAYRGAWRDQDWVSWPEHAWIDSAACMLNTAMHSWGHRYLYDFVDLSMRLRAAGFAEVERCSIGASRHAELTRLETRLDSSLVVEAWGTTQRNRT